MPILNAIPRCLSSPLSTQKEQDGSGTSHGGGSFPTPCSPCGRQAYSIIIISSSSITTTIIIIIIITTRLDMYAIGGVNSNIPLPWRMGPFGELK